MNKCKTCKHWRKTENSDNSGFGRCFSDRWVYDLDNDAPVDGVLYGDSHKFIAWFQTGKDFGCIHHEKQEGTITIEKDRILNN